LGAIERLSCNVPIVQFQRFNSINAAIAFTLEVHNVLPIRLPTTSRAFHVVIFLINFSLHFTTERRLGLKPDNAVAPVLVASSTCPPGCKPFSFSFFVFNPYPEIQLLGCTMPSPVKGCYEQDSDMQGFAVRLASELLSY